MNSIIHRKPAARQMDILCLTRPAALW